MGTLTPPGSLQLALCGSCFPSLQSTQGFDQTGAVVEILHLWMEREEAASRGLLSSIPLNQLNMAAGNASASHLPLCL